MKKSFLPHIYFRNCFFSRFILNIEERLKEIIEQKNRRAFDVFGYGILSVGSQKLVS